MSESSPFLILKQPCDEAIGWVTRQISDAGLLVVRTFDLYVARHAHASCPCPHHGTANCDCQMVVLLVYGSSEHKTSERHPVSIIAHGYNGQTWFSLVDSPQQRANPHLEAAIRQALIPNILHDITSDRAHIDDDAQARDATPTPMAAPYGRI